MDPQKTLTLLLEAIHNGSKQETLEHLESLQQWLNNDGFPPIIYKDVLNSTYHGNNPPKQFGNTQVITPIEAWIVPERL